MKSAVSVESVDRRERGAEDSSGLRLIHWTPRKYRHFLTKTDRRNLLRSGPHLSPGLRWMSPYRPRVAPGMTRGRESDRFGVGLADRSRLVAPAIAGSRHALKACPVQSDVHYLTVLRYMEQNPLRTKLVVEVRQETVALRPFGITAINTRLARCFLLCLIGHELSGHYLSFFPFLGFPFGNYFSQKTSFCC